MVEQHGPKVTVETWLRDKEDDPHTLNLTQQEVQIGDMSAGIGWWFPGGDSSLEKVVIDGEVWEGEKLASAKGVDTAVKEGSLVQGYKTMLPDDDDDDDDDT